MNWRLSIWQMRLLTLSLVFGEVATWTIIVDGAAYRFRFLDVVVGLFFVWFLPKLKKIINRPVLKSLVVLALFLFMTTILAGFGLFNGQFIGLAYWLRWLVYMLAGLALFYFQLDKAWLLSLSIIYAFIGLAQYLLVTKIGYYNMGGWDPHAYRLFGNLFDPNFYGLILFFLFYGLDSIDYPSQAKLKQATQLILLILMILTLSRTVFLILIMYGVFKLGRSGFFKKATKPKKIHFIYIFTGVIMLIILSWMSLNLTGEGVKLWRSSTIISRWLEFKQAMFIWQQHWLFGIGFNNIKLYKLKFLLSDGYSHSLAWFSSSLSSILVTGGLTGFLFWGWFLLALAKTYNFKGKFLLFIFLFHSQFHSSLFYPFTLINFFIVQSIINRFGRKFKPS